MSLDILTFWKPVRSEVFTRVTRITVVVSGFESDEFLALWKNGIRTMDGGVDSGFHHQAEQEHEPRLLQVKVTN